MPAVSVIIPNYNHSKFLVQRIESVLNQTFQDFEIILMDDCSTDDSRTILAQYSSNPKVTHTVFNEKNSGSTFKQWEKGINLAKGDYIWLAESDDWCDPTMLDYLVAGIRKDPECVISYCQSYCVRDTNQILWVSQHNYLEEVMEGKLFARTRMLISNPIFNASMVLWKRKFFPEISEEFKNYRLSGDWIFWMELANRGKVHISGRVLNYFRKHENDVSGEAFRSGLNFIEALKIISSLYTRKLISKEDCYKAFKIQYRSYYPIRKNLDTAFREEIDRLFKRLPVPMPVYYKVLLSAYWKHLKH